MNRTNKLLIKDFMTKSPHTIGQQQSLATAHRVMHQYGIRHLPVLHAGRLIGLVSQRDLQFLETLRDIDPEEVQVSEAMSQEAFSVSPQTPLSEVAATMTAHKYGSAVIIDKDHVVGVFTTIDALRALAELLNDPGRSEQ